MKFFREPEGTKSNYWLCAVLLQGDLAQSRNAILDETNAAGLMVRPMWTLMHKLKPYEGEFQSDLSQAEELERRVICLPSSPQLWKEGSHA